MGGAPVPKRNRTGPAIVDVVHASSKEVFRAVAAQYTRVDALQQTAGGVHGSRDGPAVVAAGPRLLHQSLVLRRLVGADVCALVWAALPLRAPGRDRPVHGASAVGVGTAGPGCQLRAQERSHELGHRLVRNRHGPHRLLGLEVTLLATVDVEERGAYPLCAQQSPAAT